MSLFSFSGKKGEVCILYDIASATVGAAIVRFTPSQPPELLVARRQSILFKHKPTAAKLTAEMLISLEKVSESLVKDAPKIHRVFYTFSSPWAFSQTKILHRVKDKDEPVTQAILSGLVEDTRKNNDLGAHMTLIEHKAIQVRLNGYESAQPVGKVAHTVEVPFYVSAVGTSFLEKIEHTVAKSFGFRKSVAHSFALLSYSTLRDMFTHEKHFITLDINGELTDISIIKDGVLLHTASFPLGVNSIVRYASKALDVTPQVADSILGVYFGKKIESEHRKKIDKVLEEVKTEWVRLFHESIQALGKEISVPHKLFLITNSHFTPFFRELLRGEHFSQLGVADESFDVVTIDATSLKDYCHVSGKAKLDTFLLLEAIALNKMIY